MILLVFFKILLHKISKWSRGQNIWKIPVNGFNFSKGVGLQPATLPTIGLLYKYFSPDFSVNVKQQSVEHPSAAASRS